MNLIYPSIDTCIKYSILNCIKHFSGLEVVFELLADTFSKLEHTNYVDGLAEVKKELDKLVQDDMICCDLECDCVYLRQFDCERCLPPVIRLAGLDFLDEEDAKILERTNETNLRTVN